MVARQETANLLNEYFRENTGPVDASQLNIAGDDGLFDLSGLTASDPSVQFMGTLNEEISDAQQTNNIDGSATTDVYDTATPAPDDSTDGDSTDGDSTRQNDRSCNKGELNGKQRTCHPSGPRAGREKRL